MSGESGGFMDMIGRALGVKQQEPNPQQTQQQQANGGKVNDPLNGAVDNNGNRHSASTDPNNNGNPATESPLAEFDNLFDNTPKVDDKGNPIVQPFDPNSPYINFDPEKMRESLGNTNFIDSQTQTLLEEVQNGDTSKLGDLLNAVTRHAYMSQTQLSHNVMEKTAKAVLERALGQIPNQVRTSQANDSLNKLNPAFKSPALQPVVNAIRGQVEAKYPDASPTEISEMVNRYMSGVAATFQGDSDDNQNGQQRNQQSQADWTDFFGGQ